MSDESALGHCSCVIRDSSRPSEARSVDTIELLAGTRAVNRAVLGAGFIALPSAFRTGLERSRGE